MENFNLLDYIGNNNVINDETIDALKYELSQHIYYYGENFKNPRENALKSNFIKGVLKRLFLYTKILNIKRNAGNSRNILSNAYFTVNDELRKLGYSVFSPSWRPIDRKILSDWNIYNKSKKIDLKLRHANFKELISDDFISLIDDFKEELLHFCRRQNLIALFVPNDMSFFENISIKVASLSDVPSFIFLHGIPGQYNKIDDNRSDYIIVWGNRIRENYIAEGFKPDKIFVSGHPYYKKFKIAPLRNSFESILVLTKATCGGQFSNDVVLSDRGNSILYLYSIKKVLQNFGIKKVKLRPHPSERAEWYLQYIDTNFFSIDEDNLSKSLNESSLVIGPTSSVFLESIYYGVNYVVYEPSKDGKDLINLPLVPPFNGCDERVVFASNEEDLSYVLKNRLRIGDSVFNDYIKTPFSLSFVKNLI